MSQDRMTDLHEEHAAQEVETEETRQVESDQGPVVSPAAASSMLSGPMNGIQRRMLVQSVGQHFGNKQVQRMLGTVQRARSASAGPDGGALEDDLAQRIQSERSNGQPMDTGVRSQVEASLGHDLSPVRVHTGSTSHELNRMVGAKAFTTGRDIFYGEGASPSDVELTTHESTHTIQQGFSEAAPSSVGAADTAHEHAAEHAASHVGSVGAGVQREADDEEGVARKLDTTVQREGEEEEEVQRKIDPTIQREGEEEEEVQRKIDPTVQREGEEEEEVQRKIDPTIQREGEEEEEVQRKIDPTVQREGEEEEVAA